jgi:hypothetical protein
VRAFDAGISAGRPSSSARKGVQGLRGDPDGVQDTDVRESSSRAELVDRRLADAETTRDLGDGE